MSEGFEIVHYSGIEADRFPVSGIEHWKLTETLAASEMRVNVVRLEPGQSLAEHRHEHQEEIYVTTTGGQVRIEGDRYEVPESGVVRIGPEPMRSVCNETDEETHVWIMFGAPPLGTVDDFGEFVVEEGNPDGQSDY